MSNLPVLLMWALSVGENCRCGSGGTGLPFGFELGERVVGGDEVSGDDRVGDEVQAGGADASRGRSSVARRSLPLLSEKGKCGRRSGSVSFG